MEFALGLGIALLIARITWGQRTLRTIMIVSHDVLADPGRFMFKYIFNDNIGILNNALQSLGVTDQRSLGWSTAICDVLDHLRRGVDEHVGLCDPAAGGPVRHAPRPDRGRARGRLQCLAVFRHITLPFIMPIAFIAMTIRSLDVARAYDIVQG